MRKKDNGIPLMDRAHEWTFMKKAGRLDMPVGDGAMQVQLHHRGKLKQAQRFTLDDEAVRLICRLSRGERTQRGEGGNAFGHWDNDARFPGWSFLARLPYDVCWFEYNCRVKLAEWDAMGTLRIDRTDFDDPVNPSPLKIGYLMYKDEEHGERWICHCFTTYPSGEVVCSMVAFVFDPEGDARFPVRGSQRWNAKTLSLMGDRFGYHQRGPIDPATGKLTRQRIDPELIVGGIVAEGYEMPDWLSPRVAVIIDPWWERIGHSNRINRDEFENRVAGDVREHSSHLRWIITMLASINGLPRAFRPVESRPGKRAVGMHMLPYFEHHHIVIELPKGDRVLRARQLLDKEAKNSQRKWHMVIGHWRVVEFGKRKMLCRHVPTMVEGGLGMCERCQLLVRWIPAHPRGDATLGVIDHDYEVTT